MKRIVREYEGLSTRLASEVSDLDDEEVLRLAHGIQRLLHHLTFESVYRNTKAKLTLPT